MTELPWKFCIIIFTSLSGVTRCVPMVLLGKAAVSCAVLAIMVAVIMWQEVVFAILAFGVRGKFAENDLRVLLLVNYSDWNRTDSKLLLMQL